MKQEVSQRKRLATAAETQVGNVCTCGAPGAGISHPFSGSLGTTRSRPRLLARAAGVSAVAGPELEFCPAAATAPDAGRAGLTPAAPVAAGAWSPLLM